MRNSYFFFLVLLLIGCHRPVVGKQPPVPLWTEDERAAIVAYWQTPGRYSVEPTGEERVNITVAGSTWYWSFPGAGNPPKERVEAWREYLNRRFAFDKAMVAGVSELPPDPGPLPDDLKAILGEPPALFEKVTPNRYVVVLAPEDASEAFIYTDAVPFGDRKTYFPYYRSSNGVMKAGKRVKNYTGEDRARADTLFRAIGKTESERKILQAVSALEGGFEAINTYDTGFVSIGFIQFITKRDGTGSLSAVLERHKTDDPADFAATFHRFGIDVQTRPVRAIAVVDPVTGVELTGESAVQAIIRDKRLTAVFERAGGRDGFRRAQVLVARDQYWPGDDPITVTIGSTIYTVPVSEVVKSEAGLACLMDRKVNRGTIRGISEAAQKIVEERQLADIKMLCRYEKSLVAAMKYRADFLSDASLTQPPEEDVLKPVVDGLR